VLRAVSLMIHNALHDASHADDFLGHMSPTIFLATVGSASALTMEERIRTRLEQSLDYFYPIKDRDQATMPKTRLAVRSCYLTAGERAFTSVDEIKAELLNRKK
jgi:hypothetical protein